MSKFVYRYQNGAKAFSLQEIRDIYQELEESLRTGSFSYHDQITKNQGIEIKQSWPDELRAMLKSMLTTKSRDGLVNAMKSLLLDRARERAAAKAVDKKYLQKNLFKEIKLFRTDFAMSMLFDSAPLTDPSSYVREFGDTTVRIQASHRPCKLVVDYDQVSSADVNILGMYDEKTQKCIMLGWAPMSDVESAPKGNRDTDSANCSWRKMSHYIDYGSLHPMSELLSDLPRKSFPSGIIMEKVPDMASVPWFSRLDIPSQVSEEEAKSSWDEAFK